jgi:hypothetical protein
VIFLFFSVFDFFVFSVDREMGNQETTIVNSNGNHMCRGCTVSQDKLQCFDASFDIFAHTRTEAQILETQQKYVNLSTKAARNKLRRETGVLPFVNPFRKLLYVERPLITLFDREHLVRHLAQQV